MTGPVLLDTIAHADLRVAIGYAARFGDAVNECAIFPNEFDDLQREYPILFRKDADGAFQAVALLGFDRDENLFLDESGWQARHVPALRQRGPFLIGMGQRDQQPEPMIYVDLESPRIGAADGQAVFLPHGGRAPYLDHIVRVLQVIHDGERQRGTMFAAFAQAGLIAPIALDIALDESTRYTIPDCFTIATEQLARLDGAALSALNRSGFLRQAFLVASSLGNVGRLIDLKNRRRRAEAGEAVPVTPVAA
ncbi:SapC family protein [Sphingomonas sp. H39-1-10]|uniref:SapC family protein n=1 Tax=Sphingomonas TaxID=13687 RepID=UPI00088B544B|nr:MULTISPECIES: SapC family protein [Sphingomonas]MDF0489139.1 SapC family protein [Sphingomonas pollutisoli]SDA20997.1 SapC protein [Sphingomonas sp. NFR15]